MSYDNQSGGGFQRRPFQMHDVSDLNITCVDCGTEIKELPFQPSKKEDGTFGKIYCRDCNKKRPRFNDRGGSFRRDR
jgi:hypothetical protein